MGGIVKSKPKAPAPAPAPVPEPIKSTASMRETAAAKRVRRGRAGGLLSSGAYSTGTDDTLGAPTKV